MDIGVTELNKSWILRTSDLGVSLFKWEEEPPAASTVMPLSVREALLQLHEQTILELLVCTAP